jgi:two-component system CheB/CheR fusion protein
MSDSLQAIAVREADQAAPPAPRNGSLANALERLSDLPTHERRRGTARLSEELRGLYAALDDNAIVAETDRSGTILHVNACFCRISGYAAHELIGRKHSLLNSGRHPRAFFQQMWATIARGEKWRGEICNRAKSGRLYWVDTTIVPLKGRSGRVERYLSVRFDITERKIAELALAEENERRLQAEQLLRDVIEAVPVGITAFDADDRLLLFNEAFRRFYPGMEPHIRKGMRYRTLVRQLMRHGHLDAAADSAIASWLARRQDGARGSSRPLALQLADGRWVQLREFRSESGLAVMARTDITELKEAERTIRKQAEEDPLTGLANRAVMLRRVDEALGRQSTGRSALVLIDLDDFKAVNDSLGHDAGDELLVVIARRLVGALRRGAVVGRMGGDEFAILMSGSDRAALTRRLDRIMAIVQQPVALTGRTVTPRLSMGVAAFAPGTLSRRDVFQHADIALYHAKAAGRGRHAFFDEAMLQAANRRQRSKDILREAIERDELHIALQPQQRLADGGHVGFEALARWTREDGAVAPAEFIPLAEESHLIVPLGSRILERTLSFIRAMKDRGLQPGRVAINVAAAQLKLDDFADVLNAALARHGLVPGDIEVEVTETVLLDRSAVQIGRTLGRLHELGITIALDDFGTGYASLAHLKRFHVDRLKIDRSFVSDIGLDAHRSVIPRTIVSLAHSLGMDVVAEGIETTCQRDFLHACGCGIGQGYLLASPMLPDEAEAYLRGLGQTTVRLERAAAGS